ncbi:MAG: HEAT repeat domain-containing protein [Phycisphaeraceae bacterium]
MLESLGDYGDKAKAAAPALRKLFDNSMKDPRTPLGSAPLACALVRISDDRAALRALHDGAAPRIPFLNQLVVAGYLARARPDDPLPVQAMERWVRSKGRDFDPATSRDQVIMITSHSKDAFPGLIRLMEDREAFVRIRALTMLGNLREEGIAAIADVVKALNDEDAQVRDAAALTLNQLERAASRP